MLTGHLSAAAAATSLLLLHGFVGSKHNAALCQNKVADGSVETVAECGLHAVSALVDSGASHCFIEDAVATAAGLDWVQCTAMTIALADGTKVLSREVVHMPILF